MKTILSSTYRPDIDGLRAVAILAVVLSHAFPSTFAGGFVGVDVFFVISGFLISRIIFQNLQAGKLDLLDFYTHRVQRIFPGLILVLGSVYALGWFALFPGEFKQLGLHMAAGAGFVQNVVLWKEAGYFDVASEVKPLMHLWSLAIEEQFYLIYPLFLWAMWRFRINAAVAIFVVIVLSFVQNVQGVEKDLIRTFFVPQTRFWELMVGGILAYGFVFQSWRLEKMHFALRNAFSIAGLLLILISITVIQRATFFPGWWALLPVSGAFFLILAGMQAWGNRLILSNRVMVFVGLISYPLYLWHWPLLSFARIMESGLPSMELRSALVGLSFLLAWLTYYWIERPLRSRLHSKVKSLALVFCMAMVGFVGYHTYLSDGLAYQSKYQAVLPKVQTKPPYLGLPVVVIGDSHAQHLISGLKDYFGEALVDRTSAGCIPFYGVDRYDYRMQKGACAKTMTRHLQEFEDSNTKTVVLASMGAVYLTGETFKDQGQDRVRGLGMTLVEQPELMDRWAIYRHGMTQTIQRLLAKNKNIIFVLGVPELGFEPQVCAMNRPLRLTPKPLIAVDSCTLPRTEHEQRSGAYKALVMDVLSTFPSVHVFDASQLICDLQSCRAMKEGVMLYRDADHLTPDGSRYIAQSLAPFIAKTLD